MLHLVDPAWQENPINPITEQPFAADWVILHLTDSQDYTFLNGAQNGSAYAFLVSRSYKYWQYAVSDFLQYHMALGSHILCAMSQQDYTDAVRFSTDHPYNERTLRSYEPAVLVHSTTPNGWTGIQSDGQLRSWNSLRTSDSIDENAPIGTSLGDPADFSDYIMFSDGSLSGEIVVSSKEKGFICMDADAQYLPGARLYFDAAAIARDGHLLRDGAHLKVRDHLPLIPYLLTAITPHTLQLAAQDHTPSAFTHLANQAFSKQFPQFPLS